MAERGGDEDDDGDSRMCLLCTVLYSTVSTSSLNTSFPHIPLSRASPSRDAALIVPPIIAGKRLGFSGDSEVTSDNHVTPEKIAYRWSETTHTRPE